MSTDILTPQTAHPSPVSLAESPEADDAGRRLLPDDDVPQETLDVLGQARDALLGLIGGVFQAAEAIVTALLHLVQTIAGRGAAEAVDRGVAGVLDPLVPDLPPGGDGSSAPTAPGPAEAPALPRVAVAEPGSAASSLRDDVRDVLLAHAGSDAERAAVSPAFVEMVATGAQFLLSVERQFPGAIDALQAREAVPEVDAAGECHASEAPAEAALPRAEAPPAEAVVAY